MVLKTGDDPKKSIRFISSILQSEIDSEGRLNLAAEMRDTNLQTALDLLSSFAAGLAGKKYP